MYINNLVHLKTSTFNLWIKFHLKNEATKSFTVDHSEQQLLAVSVETKEFR